MANEAMAAQLKFYSTMMPNNEEKESEGVPKKAPAKRQTKSKIAEEDLGY